MNDWPWITVLTFTPLAGGFALLGVGAERRELARRLALSFSLLSLLVAVGLWREFVPASAEMQLWERHSWIPKLGVEYYVGVDGLGLLMVLLTAMVVPMAMLASWPIQDRPRIYFALVLFLEAGLFGTFTALNFFHWFLFWELSLVPAFFLIKLWGGPQRSPAATQFFIYTMVGSIALLLAFLAIFWSTNPHTFDFIELAELGRSGQLASLLSVKLGWYGLDTDSLALVIFSGALLGFAVKVPLMPFHTWLPSAYAEAPTGTTMLLTGVMSKMGVYGFIRILMPIFPGQMRMMLTVLLWLAVMTIVFSAAAAFAQRDLKRMLAYSSINHLGYCLLGIFAVMQSTGPEAHGPAEKAAALNGVLLQMFNHGLTAAVLFGFVGFLEQRSGGLRGLNDFGGLRKVAPALSAFWSIALFASLGLPGLNGFVGEFLIFKGVFALTAWAAVLSSVGLLVTAVFLLTLKQRVLNGPLNERWAGLADLSRSERLLVMPAIALMFVLGVYPQLVIDITNTTVVHMVKQVKF